MASDAEAAGRERRTRSKDEQVADMLNKTVERGATEEEEKSAVQLAYQLVRQYRLDLDEFKASLARIGNPPRYTLTDDGFLMPAAVARPIPPDPPKRDDSRPAPSAPPTPGLCPLSPSGRHHMVPFMHGTLMTGVEYCAHCGARRE